MTAEEKSGLTELAELVSLPLQLLALWCVCPLAVLVDGGHTDTIGAVHGQHQ